MASGKIHDRSILLTTPLYASLIFSITHDPLTTLYATGYYFSSGLFFSPDLDTNSLPYKRWGYLKVIWTPYLKSRKHRGFSHTPLGALERYAIWCLPQIPLFLPYAIHTNQLGYYLSLHYLAILGFVSSALVHLFLDYVKLK